VKIGVIGLGYVGLPLVIQFAECGVEVLGIDVDESKVTALNDGKSYLRHVSDASLAKLVDASTITATVDMGRTGECEAILICVPTPLTADREPDLSFVLNTARELAGHLCKGMLVVLESTTYPGTTEDELRAVLEEGSGLRAGEDFHLAFSPEREDPGNPDSRLGEMPKVVGGYTPACLARAEAVYSRAVQQLVPVSSCRVAEATKLLENVYRSINIALVNELKLVYQEMGIDIWEVIEAAKTKPFGFTPFYPGPGLGGHCIPIDPFYLSWQAKKHGVPTRFIELAGEINRAMPAHVAGRCEEALSELGKSTADSRILLIGLAYKSDVDDCRESPAFPIWDLLENEGATVSYHDPFVPEIPQTREHAERAGEQSTPWDEAAFREFDLAVVLTAHSGIDYSQLVEWTGAVVDTRNATAGIPADVGSIWKA